MDFQDSDCYSWKIQHLKQMFQINSQSPLLILQIDVLTSSLQGWDVFVQVHCYARAFHSTHSHLLWGTASSLPPFSASLVNLHDSTSSPPTYFSLHICLSPTVPLTSYCQFLWAYITCLSALLGTVGHFPPWNSSPSGGSVTPISQLSRMFVYSLNSHLSFRLHAYFHIQVPGISRHIKLTMIKFLGHSSWAQACSCIISQQITTTYPVT